MKQGRQADESLYKLLCWKDLLYSTGNSAQRYVAAWMGGEFRGRMDTCSIWMAESLCSPPEIITALLISYIPI